MFGIFKKLFGGNDGDAIEVVATPSLPVVEPTTPMPAVKPPAKKKRQRQISRKQAVAQKERMNAKNYYKRNGRYYNADDDSIITDIMVLYVLTELFRDNEIQTFEQYQASEIEAVEEDLLDVDVSDTPVVDSTEWKVEVPAEPEPTYPKFESTPEPEPEPTRYSSGSSYGSGSSDYDSGSSDSGGYDD
jgi:hypothetical protein